MKKEEKRELPPPPPEVIIAGETTPDTPMAEAVSDAVSALDAEQSIAKKQADEINEAKKDEKRDIPEDRPEAKNLPPAFAPFPQLSEVISRRDDNSAIPGIENFLAAVGGYMRGKNIDAGEIDVHLARLFSLAYSVADGKPDLDMLELVIDGTNHAQVLAEAVAEAELRGRNANITARMKEATQSDGLPHLASRGPARNTPSDRGIFSLAESAR